MDEIKLLDSVLSHLALERYDNEVRLMLDNIFNNLKEAEIPLTKGQLESILSKLVRDNYVDHSHPDNRATFGDLYRISIEGKIFVSQGGYEQKYKDDKIMVQYHETAESTRRLNEKRLVAWTKYLTFGTLLIVLWEMLKTFWIEGHWKIFCH